ncbi:Ig-like domain repeat protein, partial [Clostridium sp. D46t1_190503_E9]|uniref:Ig-like domain repeat protein n=1 Tax=Clostridium sp. D46t1_190503_E9 TaxID=2787137 RepID=UPI00189B65BD
MVSINAKSSFLIKLKRIFTTIFLSFIIICYSNTITASAFYCVNHGTSDWWNCAYNFYENYVKPNEVNNKAKYDLTGNDGSFFFGQTGTARTPGNTYYGIIGFNFNVTYNGKKYSAAIGKQSINDIGDEIVGTLKYSLWRAYLYQLVPALQSHNPNDDFSFLYDRSFDTTIYFNAIVAIYDGKGNPSGTVDSYGRVTNGTVYTGPSQLPSWISDKEKLELYNIEGFMPKNSKPQFTPAVYGTLIEPNRPNWPTDLPTTHYHKPGSNEYWVNLKDKFTVYVESSISKSNYGDQIYPDYNYIMLRGNGTDNKIYSRVGTNNGESHDGFANNFDEIDNSSWVTNSDSSNYLVSNFKMRATKDNQYYEFGYTAVKSSSYPPWKQANQILRTDGKVPEVTFNSSETENKWTRGDVNLEISAYDIGSGLKTTKHWLQKDSNGLVSQGEKISKVDLNTSGIYDVVVEAIDNVNNTTGKITKRYLVDKTSPNGEVTVEKITTTGFDVIVKNISDAHSGVNKVKLKSRTDESYSDKMQEGSISQGKNSITFRVNTKDYDNKCGTYYLEAIITDKVGNEKKISYTVNVPYPKPIVSQIEISNYEYKDTDKNTYWVKTNDNYTAKVYGKTNPDNVRYKIDSLHALIRKLGATDFSKMRAFDAYIPNYEPIDSKYYDFSTGTNTLNTSTDLGYESYSIRKKDGYTYSYFDLIMSAEEEITINPMVRISEPKLDSDWNSYSVVVKSDGTAPTGKVTYDYNEDTFVLDMSVANIIEKGSGVDKIWAEYYPEYEEERKVTQDLINTNNVYKGKRNLFELFPDSIEPIEVVIKSIDKVGNEGELFRQVFDPFKIEATITRAWEPYQSIFQEGELGVVHVKLFGGIDYVEIEFPEELNKLAEESEEYSSLDTDKYLTPKKNDSFDYKFYVPIGAEHKIYTVKVTGHKNDKKKIVYPKMEVRGNILN